MNTIYHENISFDRTEVWGIDHAIRGMRNPMNSWERSDSQDGRIGEADMKLMKTLVAAGNEHRKFLRQIFVSVDIDAPLLWWKEFDTYKVGTTANSCSTMHRILKDPITVEDFAIDPGTLEYDTLVSLVRKLEGWRINATICKDDETGNERFNSIIRMLPESYKQKRTVTMNYENVRNMYHQRKNHKLAEWRVGFADWVESLPYASDLLIE